MVSTQAAQEPLQREPNSDRGASLAEDTFSLCSTIP